MPGTVREGSVWIRGCAFIASSIIPTWPSLQFFLAMSRSVMLLGIIFTLQASGMEASEIHPFDFQPSVSWSFLLRSDGRCLDLRLGLGGELRQAIGQATAARDRCRASLQGTGSAGR